jgi:hypothetical protein
VIERDPAGAGAEGWIALTKAPSAKGRAVVEADLEGIVVKRPGATSAQSFPR